MKPTIQLQIPEPCHESWNNMSPTQQGRFCMSCQKEVVDFSVLTDKEILQYISTASSNMCGRIANDQLNRDLAAPPEPRKIWWKYWMSIAASVIMISSKSTAQGKIVKPESVTQPSPLVQGKPAVIRMGGMATVKRTDEIKVQIRGRVVDNKNNPVPYASVKIVGGAGMAADSTGNFVLVAKSDVSNIELTVSSVGYLQKKIQVDEPANLQSVAVENGTLTINIGNILLTTQSLGEVTVNGYRTKELSGVLGGISFCRKTTRYEKAKVAFKDALGINEIKIYPNPIAINTVFNIGFNLKEQGDYTVQFTDASGKIILSKQLLITARSQAASFNGNMFAAPGIYFVSVRGKLNSKMYTTRLVVQ